MALCLGRYKHTWFKVVRDRKPKRKPKGYKVPYFHCFRCGKTRQKEPKTYPMLPDVCPHSSLRQLSVAEEDNPGTLECTRCDARFKTRIVFIKPKPKLDKVGKILKKAKKFLALFGRKSKRLRSLFRKWCKLSGKKPTLKRKKRFIKALKASA